VDILNVAILTVSSKGAMGEREDRSSSEIEAILSKHGYNVIEKTIVPDNKERIKETLLKWADELSVPLIITTGGTGLHPTDVTPQATEEIVEYTVPGISEIMRTEGYRLTPYAILSRGVSGIRGASLIINLPGSPKAVRESLPVIIPALSHALEKLRGSDRECGSD